MALKIEFGSGPLVFIVAIVLIAGAILVVQSYKTGPPVTGHQQSNANPTQGAVNSSSPISEIGFQKAPELTGITGYINAPEGLTIANLKGKVVLLDFWTYSCINCIRTLPYLKDWYGKYSSRGLVIIGVHTPEFDFEKDYNNVKNAVAGFGIKYPVVLDSDYGTWNAYNNQYWPHEFLIDAQGYIRHDHIGEGDYDATESEIVSLLNEADVNVQMGTNTFNVPSPDFSQIATPEIYVGYGEARQPIGNSEGFNPGQVVSYAIPANLQPNAVYFGGNWKNDADSMELDSNSGTVELLYTANKANIVAASPSGSKIVPTLNGNTITSSSAGADASNTDFSVSVNGSRLYNITSTVDYGQKLLVLNVYGKGFKLYTFTFG